MKIKFDLNFSRPGGAAAPPPAPRLVRHWCRPISRRVSRTTLSHVSQTTPLWKLSLTAAQLIIFSTKPKTDGSWFPWIKLREVENANGGIKLILWKEKNRGKSGSKYRKFTQYRQVFVCYLGRRSFIVSLSALGKLLENCFQEVAYNLNS